MSTYLKENNIETTPCDVCGNTMHKTKTDIDLHCGIKTMTIKGIEAYRCPECENEVIADQEFEMIENLFINKYKQTRNKNYTHESR